MLAAGATAVAALFALGAVVLFGPYALDIKAGRAWRRAGPKEGTWTLRVRFPYGWQTKQAPAGGQEDGRPAENLWKTGPAAGNRIVAATSTPRLIPPL